MADLGTDLLLAIVGLCGGVIAGLVGLAGGIFIVPALVAIYGTAGMGDAIVVSFFAVLFNSITTSRANLKAVGPELYWNLIRGAHWYIYGAIGASFLIAVIFGRHVNAIPKQMLAALQLMLAMCMLIPRAWYEQFKFDHSEWKDTTVGAMVGGVSTLIGVGGGTYTIFYFLIHGRAIKDCTLTANFVGIFIGLMSIVGYYGYAALAALGNVADASVIDATGKIILVVAGALAAPLGVLLQRKAPAALIKRLVVFFLLASSGCVLFSPE